MVRSHDASYEHPCPHEDDKIGRRIKGTEVCGFINYEQLFAWFTDEEIVTMAKAGYTIKKYDVPNAAVILGNTQVLVRKKIVEERRCITN